jgi:hypothetical protein
MTSIETAYADYNDLLSSLDNDASKGTVYEQIMAKEQNRIDLINRVVEEKNQKKWDSTIFYNNTVMDIAIQFASTWRTIFKQLFVDKRFDQWQTILYDGDRKIYSGMMLVLIAMFLFFVNISE